MYVEACDFFTVVFFPYPLLCIFPYNKRTEHISNIFLLKLFLLFFRYIFLLLDKFADNSYGDDQRNKRARLLWWTCHPDNRKHCLWIWANRISCQSCMCIYFPLDFNWLFILFRDWTWNLCRRAIWLHIPYICVIMFE